jgi:hypothetical protein
MIVNLVLILFLLFMAYWWSQQGLFSGLLHLISVIVAGSLAFAFWEPLTGMTMNMLPGGARYAWGASLILSFCIFLGLIRLAYDKLVGRNMHFPPIVNLIGGAAMGLFAAILTSGIVLLGVGFMHVPSSFGGYEPVILSGSGEMQENAGGKLWVAVDAMTADFFSGLSGGAFACGTPMAEYQPQLLEQAWAFRAHTDPFASRIVLPGTVEATSLVAVPTPIAGLSAEQRQVQSVAGPLAQGGKQAVAVMTTWTWNDVPGTFDQYKTVRIAPSQIRLATRPRGEPNGAITLHAPIAASKRPAGGTSPLQFVAFDSSEAYISGVENHEFGFLFVIDADDQPLRLMVRHTRVPLPDSPKKDSALLVAAIGGPIAPPAASSGGGDSSGGPTQVGQRDGFRVGAGAVDIEVSDKLPRRVAQSAVPTNVKYSGSAITSADGMIKPPGGRLGSDIVEKIHHPSHIALVRVTLAADRAQSAIGGAISSAASLGGVYVTDDGGSMHQPIGYVWLKASGEQYVYINTDQRVRAAREMKIREMGDADTIYVYFDVPVGRNIVKYQVGQTSWDVDPPLATQ